MDNCDGSRVTTAKDMIVSRNVSFVCLYRNMDVKIKSCLGLLGWNTGCGFMWTKYSKNDECRGM